MELFNAINIFVKTQSQIVAGTIQLGPRRRKTSLTSSEIVGACFYSERQKRPLSAKLFLLMSQKISSFWLEWRGSRCSKRHVKKKIFEEGISPAGSGNGNAPLKCIQNVGIFFFCPTLNCVHEFKTYFLYQNVSDYKQIMQIDHIF